MKVSLKSDIYNCHSVFYICSPNITSSFPPQGRRPSSRSRLSCSSFTDSSGANLSSQWPQSLSLRRKPPFWYTSNLMPCRLTTRTKWRACGEMRIIERWRNSANYKQLTEHTDEMIGNNDTKRKNDVNNLVYGLTWTCCFCHGRCGARLMLFLRIRYLVSYEQISITWLVARWQLYVDGTDHCYFQILLPEVSSAIQLGKRSVLVVKSEHK